MALRRAAEGPEPAATKGAVTKVARISLTVAELAASEEFYVDVFGFELVAKRTYGGPAFSKLLGIPELSAQSSVLALGHEQIELVSFQPPGRTYPSGSNSADLWFQHFALVVADMREAFTKLRRRTDFTPISRDGPELLPANTGGVTAYKFRDPDGHPLELSYFPPGVGAPVWQSPRAGSVFLGIDHSALSVSDTQASIAFYGGLLGMDVTFRSVNIGPEQERLDGLASDGVEITVLQPGFRGGPHLELLGYRGVASRRPNGTRANDIAATRTILETDNIAHLLGDLAAAGVPFCTSGAGDRPGPACAEVLTRDRDGHLLHFTASDE